MPRRLQLGRTKMNLRCSLCEAGSLKSYAKLNKHWREAKHTGKPRRLPVQQVIEGRHNRYIKNQNSELEESKDLKNEERDKKIESQMISPWNPQDQPHSELQLIRPSSHAVQSYTELS